jgi:hypothetical protein
VISWFSQFASKGVNSCRYVAVCKARLSYIRDMIEEDYPDHAPALPELSEQQWRGPRRALTPPDPQLKGAWYP